MSYSESDVCEELRHQAEQATGEKDMKRALGIVKAWHEHPSGLTEAQGAKLAELAIGVLEMEIRRQEDRGGLSE